VAAASQKTLILDDKIRIKDITQGAYELLGTNGIIAASTDHECSECSQPYKATPDVISGDPSELHAPVKMVVLDGVVMGPKRCAFGDGECMEELSSARGGVFCHNHNFAYGVKCRVVGCESVKVGSSQACRDHQNEWKKFRANCRKQEQAGFRRALR
ncbi:hypothetical protein BDN72DRAFT_727969, partial [Pluteus cervinus]